MAKRKRTQIPDNEVRWRAGSQQGHVESFFLKANDPDQDRALWIKFTILARTGAGEAVGEVWAIYFDRDGGGHVAAKGTWPIRDLKIGASGIGMTLGDCRLIPGHTVGRLTAPDGTPISWELTYDAHRTPLYPLPYDAMYTGPLPKNKTLTPTADSRFRGFFEAGDRCLDLADWEGMQGHNWGQSHAKRYAWAHCNVFEDCEGTVFEGISAQIKLGPITTPLLSAGLLVHQGVTYKFNALHNWLRAAPVLTYTSWQFTLRDGPRRLHGRLWTESDQMVGLFYENPAGGKIHCLNSKVAFAELRLTEHGQEKLRLRSPGKAALEVAVKEPDHGIKMYV